MLHSLLIVMTLASLGRLFFLPVWLQECSGTADPPQLSITVSKSTFLLEEDFEVKACLTNTLEDTLRIDDLYFEEGLLRFDAIVGPDSVIQIVSGVSGCYPQSRDLAPGEEICRWVNLTSYLGKSDKPSRYRHSIVGKFKLVGVYRANCNSDTLELEFALPTGVDTIGWALVESLRHVYSLQKIHEYAVQIDEFVAQNPHSVYSPMLLEIREDADNRYRDRENSDYLEIAKRLVADYPNSVRAVGSFHNILRTLPLEKRIKYLKEIESKYNGTRIGEFAETILKSKKSVYITNEKI